MGIEKYDRGYRKRFSSAYRILYENNAKSEL